MYNKKPSAEVVVGDKIMMNGKIFILVGRRYGRSRINFTAVEMRTKRIYRVSLTSRSMVSVSDQDHAEEAKVAVQIHNAIIEAQNKMQDDIAKAIRNQRKPTCRTKRSEILDRMVESLTISGGM